MKIRNDNKVRIAVIAVAAAFLVGGFVSSGPDHQEALVAAEVNLERERLEQAWDSVGASNRSDVCDLFNEYPSLTVTQLVEGTDGLVSRGTVSEFLSEKC